LPEEERAALFRTAHTRNRFLIDELKRVLEALRAADLRALPFKGPLLAHRAYPGLRYRVAGDLDLLVAPADLSAVWSVLYEHGYVHVDVPSPLQRRMRTLIHSQHTFTRGGAVFFLDVHTRIMPPLYAYDPGFDALWDRAGSVDLLGEAVPALAPPDQLLMLCYQGVKNRWDRLKYVADVAAVLQATPALDGAALLAHARALQSERSLLLGCALARRLLGAPLPAPVADRLAAVPVVDALAARCEQALADPEAPVLSSFRDRAWFQLQVQDGWGARLRYVGYALVRKLIHWTLEAPPARSRRGDAAGPSA